MLFIFLINQRCYSLLQIQRANHSEILYWEKLLMRIVILTVTCQNLSNCQHKSFFCVTNFIGNILFNFQIRICISLEIRRFTLGHTFFVLFTQVTLFSCCFTITLNLLVSLHEEVSINFNIIYYLLSFSLNLFPLPFLSLSLSLFLSLFLFFLSLSPSFLSLSSLFLFFFSLSISLNLYYG